MRTCDSSGSDELATQLIHFTVIARLSPAISSSVVVLAVARFLWPVSGLSFYNSFSTFC